MEDNCIQTSEDMPKPTYLTSEELMLLRKASDTQLPPSIGEKFYVADKENDVCEKAVEGARHDFQEMLQQKRAVRICDLMQAEWNEEASIAITKKLKGKFIQHVGHSIPGRTEIALSPEEAVFMLENGHLEILHGEMPMSTEEAYSIMLKGPMGVEKYQVYSHLSRLGFIVVNHNLKPVITRYEKLMNLDKVNLKKRKRAQVNNEDESTKKKSLDFSGCINNNLILNAESHHSENSNSEVEKIPISESHTTATECSQNQNKENQEIFSNESNNSVADCESDMEVGTCDQESLTQTKSDDTSVEHSYEPTKEQSNDTSAEKLKDSSVSKMDNTSCEMLSICNDNMEEISVVPGVTGDEANQAKCQADDSDVLAIEPEDTDIEDSEDADEDSNSKDEESCTEFGKDNSCDVLCVSSKDEQSNSVASLNSDDPLESQEKELQVEDGIFFVEVKKKESKPLAVIDILSDDESEAGNVNQGSDDDIQVIKVCSKSSNRQKRPNRKAFTKYLKCKSEGNERPRVRISSDMWKFPDLAGKSFACLPRPPGHLLPPNVRPAKEAYPIDLETLTCSQERSEPRRVWNSYKDLQERSQQRFPNSHSQGSRFELYAGCRDNNYSQEQQYSRDRSTYSYNSGRGSSHMPFTSMESQLNPRVANLPPMSPFVSAPPLINPESLNQMVLANTLMHTNRNPNLLNYSSNRLAEEVQRAALSVATSVLSSMFGGAEYAPHAPNQVFPRNPQRLSQQDQERSLFNLVESARYSSSSGSAHEHRHFQREELLDSNGLARQSSPWVTEPQARHLDSGRDFGGKQFPQMPPDQPNYWHQSRGHNSYDSRRFHRRERYHRFRSHQEFKKNVYPCAIPRRGNSQSWRDYKSTMSTQEESRAVAVDDGDEGDIEVVPININEVLWTKEINPLIKPGVQLPVEDVYTCLRITRPAKLSENVNVYEKYLPTNCSIEISFDVYLPGSTYRKSCPGIPNHRIVVVRSTDPFPKLGEMVVLQRKFNDGAFLQFAIVDNGDITFYSFNNIELPSVIPHRQ